MDGNHGDIMGIYRKKGFIKGEALRLLRTNSVRENFKKSKRDLERGYPITLVQEILTEVKVARYSFSGSIPPKFDRKLRRHKQRFGEINTTVVLDKDENLLRSGLQ